MVTGWGGVQTLRLGIGEDGESGRDIVPNQVAILQGSAVVKPVAQKRKWIHAPPWLEPKVLLLPPKGFEATVLDPKPGLLVFEPKPEPGRCIRYPGFTAEIQCLTYLC